MLLNTLTDCTYCEKSFAVMEMERAISGDQDSEAIKVTYTFAGIVPPYCPFCGNPFVTKESLEIGLKAAEKARAHVQKNGDVEKPAPASKKNGHMPRRVRQFGIYPDRMYKHGELMKIFGWSWGRRIKEAREKGNLKASSEGPAILYSGFDVIEWRFTLKDEA